MTPPTDALTRFILSVIVVTGFYVTVFLVFFVPLPVPAHDIALVLLGAMIASFKEVTGFSFGTSAGSAAKDGVIATQAAKVPPPPIVTITASALESAPGVPLTTTITQGSAPASPATIEVKP